MFDCGKLKLCRALSLLTLVQCLFLLSFDHSPFHGESILHSLNSITKPNTSTHANDTHQAQQLPSEPIGRPQLNDSNDTGTQYYERRSLGIKQELILQPPVFHPRKELEGKEEVLNQSTNMPFKTERQPYFFIHIHKV